MQVATGITEPDYGVIFDDMVVRVRGIRRVRPLLERAHRGRARLRAREAARGPARHGLRRARRDGLRGAGARDPELAHRAAGPHDRRHDQRQRRDGRHGRRRPTREGRRRRPPLGRPRCSTATRPSRSRASPPRCSATPPWASPGSRTSSPSTGSRSAAGEIILAGSFTRPMWVERGDTVHADYGAAGGGHMPVRVNLPDDVRRAPRRLRPPAGRHVGVLGQPDRRRDRRGQRPRLGAHRRRALPQRPRVDPRAAPGRVGVPGGAGRAPADRRHRADQAVPRPRRAEPARADGRLGRAGRRARAGGAVPRRTAFAASARSLARSSRWNRVDDYLHERVDVDQPHRADRVGDRGRGRRRDRRGRRRRRALRRARPTSRPRWACSGSRTTPTSSAAVLPSIDAGRAAGKPVGVNAFAPDDADRYLAAGAASSPSAPTSRSSRARPRRSPTASSERMPGTAARPAPSY